MNNIERAVDLFANGLNCSQAILTVFGEPYGLDHTLAAGLGRPLGGGMGKLGRTCGAVSAAVLVLGLAKDGEAEEEARKKSHSSVQELVRRFEATHGTTECKGLLGVDMTTEQGRKKIKEDQLVARLCPAFVKSAAGILERLLVP